MADEWEEVTLSDITESMNTGLDAIQRAPIVSYPTGIKCLRIQDISNGKHVSEWGDTDVRDTDYERYRLREGEIIMARTCSTGINFLVKENMHAVFNNGLARIRLNRLRAFPQFMYYVFKSREFINFIYGISGGTSVQLNMKVGDAARFRFQLPKLAEQQAIACVLGALDDKIESNRRMNRTLEAIVRAIFKSWFVDFDPVRAKATGRIPTGFSHQLADEFPDSVNESSLGLIPAGWRACRWGDIGTLEYGKGLTNYVDANGPYQVFGTNGPIGWHTESLCKSAGIVIGRKGAYRGIHYSPKPFFVIDTAFYLNPKVPIDLKWAYYELLKCDINCMDSGSAIPSTSRADFYSIPVCLPSLDVLRAFGKLTQPLYDRRDAADDENATLATLRDTLLPKLISGELRVTDAERITGRML